MKIFSIIRNLFRSKAQNESAALPTEFDCTCACRFFAPNQLLPSRHCTEHWRDECEPFYPADEDGRVGVTLSISGPQSEVNKLSKFTSDPLRLILYVARHSSTFKLGIGLVSHKIHYPVYPTRTLTEEEIKALSFGKPSWKLLEQNLDKTIALEMEKQKGVSETGT